MPDLSAFVPETHENISAGYVETLFQTRREELFTGLMRLSHASGEKLVFTFLEGLQQKSYRCLENTTETISKQTWLEVLDHSNASVGFLRLPVEALRFTRVVYESPILHTERFSFTPEELKEIAEKWAAEQESSIVYIHGEKLDRFYLIAGHSSPIIEELSFVEGEARFSIGDASFPQTLPKAAYQIVRYVSKHKHEVWREYELRLAFSPLIRMLLHRFGELAGRALTERLCEQLTVWAREAGWGITITGNGAVNRHYFDSLESATGAYADLLRRFHEAASPALGSRMMDSISHEVLMKLDPYRRELLTQSIYSRSGVGGVTGLVWR